MRIFDLLRLPDMATVDIDGEERVQVHRRILARRPMIREVFAEFHAIFADCDARYFSGAGAYVEIGAGAAPMRDRDPSVLATDLVYSSHLDCVIDAQRLALKAGSVRALFAQHCFHHIPEPDAFFCELTRVLVSGGGAVLIEPYYGPLASLVFKRLFASENFDVSVEGWSTPATGPSSGANQALSYIVFERDRPMFEKKYPELEIVTEFPLGNYIRYLASGGLNFKQFAPDVSVPLLKAIEFVLRPLKHQLALHHVVVLRKRTPPPAAQ
jgi:SAM-dependent methyltransferase